MSDVFVSAQSNGKDFDPIPAGVHVARCYGIFCIGTQEKEWKGETKRIKQVILSFELPDERIKIKDKETGEEKDLPRAISQTYSLSIGPKSNLRKDLVNWRGKDFTKEEEDSFSLKNVLGKSCMLQIIHKPKEGGGVWANISTFMSLPKGQKHETPENPMICWNIGDPIDGVPAWILKKAMSSDDWSQVDQPPPVTAEEKHEEDDSQNVPF